MGGRAMGCYGAAARIDAVSRHRRMLGDLARMVAATLLCLSSFAVCVHALLGYPPPIWHRVAIAAGFGVALALVSERLSPLF